MKTYFLLAMLCISLCCKAQTATNFSTNIEINGIKLTDYIQLYKELGEEYDLVVIDNYNDCGINFTSKDQCFTGTDTTHPNEVGRQMIAENMSKVLYENFG